MFDKNEAPPIGGASVVYHELGNPRAETQEFPSANDPSA